MSQQSIVYESSHFHLQQVTYFCSAKAQCCYALFIAPQRSVFPENAKLMNS